MPLVPLVRLRWPGDVVTVAEHFRQDLAEAEGDQREVVALQSQCRRADDDAGQRGDEPGNDDHDPEREVDPRDLGAGRIEEVDVERSGAAGDVDGEVGHEPGPDIRADQEESDVAEVEQPGEADDDVEAEGEECIDRTQHDGEQRQVAVGLLGEPQVRQHEGKGQAAPPTACVAAGMWRT